MDLLLSADAPEGAEFHAGRLIARLDDGTIVQRNSRGFYAVRGAMWTGYWSRQKHAVAALGMLADLVAGTVLPRARGGRR